MADSRPNFAASGSELSGPLPLSAQADVPSLTWGMLLDQPLETASLDVTNWSLVKNFGLYRPTTAVALENHVGGSMAFDIGSIVSDRISYLPPPADLRSANGTPAPSIVNFPLG